MATEDHIEATGKTPDEMTAFLLRALLYLVAQQPNQRTSIDLVKVAEQTQGLQLTAEMEGANLKLFAVKQIITPPKPPFLN